MACFWAQAHRQEPFTLSNDPQLTEKVRDIVGIYVSPPVNALVLCVNERSQIQALSRTQPLLPLRPGQSDRRTPEYLRHGTTTLFAALDIATGQVLGKCSARHRSVEFRRFFDHIEDSVPAELDIHFVMDNYATHKTALIQRWLLRHPRYHLHFTPTHASWINQVERFFGLLTQRQIKRGYYSSVAELLNAIHEFIDQHNSGRDWKWVRQGGGSSAGNSPAL